MELFSCSSAEFTHLAKGYAIRPERSSISVEGLQADHCRVTDQDGRCSTLLDPSTKLVAGIYKMKFGTGDYFDKLSKPCFYPFVEVRSDCQQST